MNTKFAFLLLHYKNADVTMRCVDSIISMESREDYDIVIVDNASENGSFEELREKYKSKSNVHFLANEVNLGYARGNNVGFAYAKNVLHADFICLANNDVIFRDGQWIEKVCTLYEREHFYVMGPDVVTLNGEHQNPFREKVSTTGCVLKNLIHDMVVYVLLKIGLQKKLSQKIHAKSVWEACDWKASQYNFSGVLHGSCLIFSPLFINEFDGLYNGTFLYVEEDILCYILNRLNYKYIYSSEVQVLHCHATSFKRTIQDESERKMVTVKHRIRSYAKFLRITLKRGNIAQYLKS